MNRALYRYLKLLLWMRKFQHKNLTIPMVFEKFVQEHPQKACYIFEDKVWTFKMVFDNIRATSAQNCCFVFVL